MNFNPLPNDVLSLPVVAYDAGGEVRIEVAKQRDGTTLWVVRRGPSGSCLARDGQWEYEPLPSSRDAAFLARCRYSNAQEALDFLTRVRAHQAGS